MATTVYALVSPRPQAWRDIALLGGRPVVSSSGLDNDLGRHCERGYAGDGPFGC